MRAVTTFFAAMMLIGSGAAPVAAQQADTAATLPIIGTTPITVGTSLSFESAIMGEARTINVMLPAAYASSGDKAWPVLYVIDGGVGQDLVHIAALANLGGLSGMYSDMIVVGIETRDRRHELTTPTDRADYRKQFPTLGGAAKFRAHIAQEIIPFIESQYRTSDRRVVIGESLAAFWITDTFLNAPGLFTDHIAISPSLWWDEMALAKAAPQLLAALPKGARSLYLTVANEGGDHRKGNDALAKAITAARLSDVKFTYVPRDAEEHSTIYHGAALDALRWLAIK